MSNQKTEKKNDWNDNYNEKDIKEIINHQDNYGWTPLDYAYAYNDSPDTNDIVSLLRKIGGKAYCHDKNGNVVRDGKGDLNNLSEFAKQKGEATSTTRKRKMEDVGSSRSKKRRN